jgi:hypothetical protein
VSRASLAFSVGFQVFFKHSEAGGLGGTPVKTQLKTIRFPLTRSHRVAYALLANNVTILVNVEFGIIWRIQRNRSRDLFASRLFISDVGTR